MSEFETRVRSVKYADGQVEIVTCQTHQAKDDERETTMRSSDEPRPELNKAMQALQQHVRKLLRLPDTWAGDGLHISKVVWSYSKKTDVTGATICCQAKLDCADAPLVFNTPHLPFEQYSEGGNAPLMQREVQAALREVEKEALLYLDGSRAQGSLFDGLDVSVTLAR